MGLNNSKILGIVNIDKEGDSKEGIETKTVDNLYTKQKIKGLVTDR